MIYVDAFIGAAGREHDLLGLTGCGCGRWGEGDTANGGGMGVEEEGVGELHVRSFGLNHSRDSMEYTVVGACDNLDRCR